MHQNRSSLLSQDNLHAILEQVRSETNVPAIGAVVSIDGERIGAAVGSAALNRGHELSERSRFEMSCLMKLATSLVALELGARGQLDLDAPIERVLPEIGARDQSAPITARHLMSHTSGYRGVDISEGPVRWGFSWDKLVEHLQSHERSFPPGRVFNYEHTEHILLAEIIRRQSGRTTAQWAQALIFDACGFEPLRSSPAKSQSDAFVAHHIFNDKRGGFVAAALPPFSSFWETSLPDSTITLTDMAAIGELLLRASRDDAAAGGISATALRTLHQCDIRLPLQMHSSLHHEQVPIGFGTAMARYAADLLGHNASSSGQTTGLRLDPKRGLVIAVGVNAYVTYARDAVIERVLEKLDRADTTVAAAQTGFSFQHLAGSFTPDQLCGRYVGSYFGQIDVWNADEALHLDLGPQRRPIRPRVSVVPSDGAHFVLESAVPTLVGFFPHPVNGEPVLAMGVHAYRKQSVSS
jgi:CubicO group peptidase (beta-lactamase class C family)